MSAPPERATAIRYAALPSAAFHAPRPVRFGDCDPAGIVFTPRFVEMACGAVEDLFHTGLGLDYYGILRDDRIGLGWVRVECDFFLTAAMGDHLTLTVLVERIGGASAAYVVHAHRGEAEIMRVRMVMVTTSLEIHRPIPLPPQIREALAGYFERCGA